MIFTKHLLFIVYFGMLLLNVVGIIIPDIVDRNNVMFFHIPILIVMYMQHAKTKNYLFLIALIMVAIGVCYFNFSNKHLEVKGLLCYTIATIIYVYSILKNAPLLSLKKMVSFIPITVGVFIIGSYVILKSVEGFLFYSVIFYAMVIVCFVHFALLNYTTSKSIESKWLLISAILMMCSSLISGYSLFIRRVILLNAAELLSFSLAHFFMTIYMIEISKKAELKAKLL